MIDVMPDAAWNQTERVYPEALLHEAFAAQAAREPSAPAIRFRDEMLTYAELDQRIGRLAGRLLTLGVEPGSLVAVCMDRSVEMVVALHAILRSGGAYIPIDPEYPDERIAFMLDDLDEPILLTQQRLADRFTGMAAQVVSIEGPSDPVAGPIATDLPHVSPDDLAYVIYTSGSTGHRQPHLLDAGAVRPNASGQDPAEDAVQLRRLGMGVLLAAAVRRGARHRRARRASRHHVSRPDDHRMWHHDDPLRPLDAPVVPGGPPGR